MKRFKKLTLLLAAAMMLLLLPSGNALLASAAEPATYYVYYDAEDTSPQWRFIEGNQYTETGEHREMYYLVDEGKLKDGDVVVVDCANANGDLKLPKHLSNLTVLTTDSANSQLAIIFTGGVDYCDILKDASASITGDVAEAHVYDHATANFNNNVSYLVVTGTEQDIYANVGVAGTVGHLHAESQSTVHYELYDFPAGRFAMKNGLLGTDEAYYSKTPSAQGDGITAPAAPAAPAAATPAAAPQKEYDDVPKTGDSSLYLWLFAISGLCFAGRRLVKRS